MPLLKKIFIISWVSLISIGIDQLSKVWASETLSRDYMTSYLADTLRIGYVENTGAFLGIGSTLPDGARFAIFVVAVGAILLALLVYMLRTNALNTYSLTALACVFSGGVSNFYDRALNNGAVIDFINMGIGSLRTGIFNIADVAIMLGLFIYLFAHREEKPTTGDDTPSPASQA